MHLLTPSRHITALRCRTLAASSAAAVVATILGGPIYAQVVPVLPVTRTWDAITTAPGTFNWGDAVNWSADTLPGVSEIAAFPAPNSGTSTTVNIDLGGVSREVEAVFLGTAGGSANYIFQNGTLVTNNINQNQADPNAFNSTALISSKNGGADVLNVSVSSDTLQLQGQITSAGLNKFGNSVLRLGTSGTAFDNAINGNITIFGGTLRASASSAAGLNNPLGGTGDIVIGNSGVALQLEAQIASGEYDFVRDIRAGDKNFTLTNNNASGTDPGDPTMRVGTVFIGNATMTSSSNSGYRNALDGLNLAAGSIASRVQVNTQLLTVHSLVGEVGTNLYKRGGSDLEIRGDNEAGFAGNLHIKEGVVRLLSTVAGVNPAGGADSTIVFGNGYGIAALDGGQQLQLRSDTSLNFGSNLAFAPGVTIGRISIDRTGTTATAQTMSLGTANISGGQLNITGANSYLLELAGVTVNAGATGVINPTSANTRVGTLNVGIGGTLVKTGGSQLFLSGDNSTTMLGTLVFRGGELVANVAGSLGVNAVSLGTNAINTAGFMSETGILRWNANGATTNSTGSDVVVNRASQVDLNVTPVPEDVFELKAGGIIQGNSTQFAGLSVGSNLFLEEDAILGHETHATVSQITGLTNAADLYYGIAGTANTVLPTIGVGTPWKGISNDRSTRSIARAGTPISVPINGGDDNMGTIEAVFQGVNGTSLTFGSNTTTDSYVFESTSGQKVTLAIRGIGGTGIAVIPGGNVAFEDAAATTGMANVDKIHVESGTLLLGANNSLGGVPVDVLNGGGLDIRTTAAFDGPVTIKSGGVLFLNDNINLSGSGTVEIQTGGKLQITGTPVDILASGQPISFTGTNHTVRFGPNDLINLDAVVPNSGVTYVIAGGGTAAVLGQSNLNVTTNTQSAGITLENGILTNDGTSRGFVGPINLNNSNFTVAASRGTSLGILSPIATTGNVQVGSNSPIDFRDKTQNPDRVNTLGYLNPHDGHSQVLFLDSVSIGGDLEAHAGTRLSFADPNTNIAGDLTFNGTVLYLDGGGELSGGASTRGGLTARLTDASGFSQNRVADNIILGNYARTEMSVAGAGPHTITQPFVITGLVNPSDKRTFWIDRADSAGTPAVILNDILLKDGAQFGVDENNTAVRASLRVDGNVTMVRNHDNYDIRNVLSEPTAPANVTVKVGEPASLWDDTTETLHQGSNDTLVQSVDGIIGAGVTVDLIRGQWLFEHTAEMHGIIRAQTAPARGDAFIVFRSTLPTPHTFTSAVGEVQIGRSVAANGPEDLELRGAEVTSGEAAALTLDIPVRVVNDGVNANIDGIIRSARNNDSTIATNATIANVTLEAGARVQLVPLNQIPLTVSNLTLLGDGGIDTTYAPNPANTVGTFLPAIQAGANTLNITGPAQTRITGDLTAGGINVSGAGLVLDRGLGVVTTLTQPMSLNGNLTVNTGDLNLGENVITGAPVQTVAGLREHKTWGSFDLATANTSNQVALGLNFAQAATPAWGENQTVTYSGKINIPDNGTAGDGFGSVAFGKWFDDSVRITIGGTVYMNNTGFSEGVSTGAINLSTGWHDFEVRLGQGTGGAGATAQDGGVTGLGLGIDLNDPISSATHAGVGVIHNGTAYVAPVDDGSMSLFQTTTLKSNITLGAGTNLTAGGFSAIGAMTLGSGNTTVSIGGPGASDAESLSIPTASTTNIVLAQQTASLTVGTLNSLATVTKSGDGTLTVTGGHHFADGTGFTVQTGAVRLQGTGTGLGTVFLDNGLLEITGSVTGGVSVSSGLLTGNSTSPTTGMIGGLTEINGGNIMPNLGLPGSMLLKGGVTFGGGGLAVDLAGNTPGTEYDQVVVTGAVDFNANVPLTLTLGFQPAIGDEFAIILNDTSADLIGGFGRFSYNGTALAEGDSFLVADIHEFSVSYLSGDGNDAVLTYVVPEPGALALLMGGVGMVCVRRRRAQANRNGEMEKHLLE